MSRVWPFMYLCASWVYEVYMKWTTAKARQNLSQLLRAASEEPQIITNRGRPVAAVIGDDEFEAFKRWRDTRPAGTLGDTLDELRAASQADAWSLPVASRRDRPNPFVEGGDGLPD